MRARDVSRPRQSVNRRPVVQPDHDPDSAKDTEKDTGKAQDSGGSSPVDS
jgi:hypothetical protein